MTGSRGGDSTIPTQQVTISGSGGESTVSTTQLTIFCSRGQYTGTMIFFCFLRFTRNSFREVHFIHWQNHVARGEANPGSTNPPVCTVTRRSLANSRTMIRCCDRSGLSKSSAFDKAPLLTSKGIGRKRALGALVFQAFVGRQDSSHHLRMPSLPPALCRHSNLR